MTSITVRNVPEATRDELAARARASGRSLQEYLRSELIELARRPDLANHIERIRARKEAARSHLGAAEILELRDVDRR